MKKTYIQPAIREAETELDLICLSEYIISDYDISYGGIDDGGLKDPSVNRQFVVWTDDDEEEE